MTERGDSRQRLSAEELCAALVVAGAAALFIAIEWLAEPLSTIYLDRGYEWFVYVARTFVRPEPEEAASFLLAVAIPIAVAATVALLGGRRPPDRRLDWPLAILQAVIFGFVCWNVWEQFDVRSIAFLGAFERGLLPTPNLIAAPLIGLGLTALALGWDSHSLRRIRDGAERLSRAPAWVAAMIAALATTLWLLPGVITDGSVGTSGLIPLSHIPIEFDEFISVSNGRTPLVDYVPWYSSLLPLGLSWLWPLTDYSITSFTTTMVLLSGAALLAAFAAFRQLTGNGWHALALYVPFLALALQPWDTAGAVREYNGNYYAIMPQRYLGPLVLAWLCARHLSQGSPPLWLLFGVAGLVTANNPEFGGVAAVAAVGALLAGSDREALRGPRLRGAALEAAAGFGGAVLLVCAVILVRSGELPEPGLFAYVSRLTSRGYGMFPIPDWGLHWALYVTYTAALLTASVRIAIGSPDRVLTGLLAFAGLFGLLTGGYFLGRSLPWQLWGLFPAWALALALLGLLAWNGLRTSGRDSLLRVGVGAFAALSGFGLMVAAIDRFPLPWQQVDRIAEGGAPYFDDSSQVRFIEERTDPGEPILIVGPGLGYRVAERADVENVSPWFSYASIFGPAEADRAVDQLESQGGEVVFLNITPDPKTQGDVLLGQLSDFLRERGYERGALDPDSSTYEWRRAEPG